ncbi:hypothetical protein OAN10_01185 [Alphaproteobacteria bacterium]|nr:hypothetical protein [Alphaproteobacteria bacterium]
MIKIVFLLFFLLASHVVSSKDLNSFCDFDTSQNILEIDKIENLKGLEIKINKYKKWVKNSLLILTKNNKSINKKFKKKFSAELTVFYTFGKCKYPVEIRHHGDQNDHIYFTEGGRLNQSIDISMTQGSVIGRTKFKLFTPESRPRDEIILTTILTELKYLSPITFLTKVRLNNSESTMLFQEKASKEFLENNKRVEGPIFEGDERFIWTDFGYKPFELEKISLSRMVNEKIILKGLNKDQVAIYAFNLLQKIYLKYAESCFRCGGKNGSIFIDLNILSNNSIKLLERWKQYEILLISSNAIHGLRPSNRKFFWNMHEMGFEPIYYDGGPKLNTKNLKLNYLGGDEDDYLSLINDNDFNQLSNRIKNLDSKKLYKTIYKKGLKINFNEFQTKLDNLQTNINNLKEHLMGFSEENNNTQNDYINSFLNKLESLEINFDFYKIINKDKKVLSLAKCKDNQITCEKIVLSRDDVSKILSGIKVKKTSEGIVLPNYKLSSNLNYTQNIIKGKKINIFYSKNSKIEVSENKNLIKITLNNKNDWAIIKDSDLSSIDIQLEGFSSTSLINSNTGNKVINELGYTGCLTIYSSNFNKTNIKANNSTCEDTINIINSKGSINKITITNSFADALDIDFSDIKINELEVINAKNDCVDLSWGNYYLYKSVLSNCGDKAISIGEKSTVNGGLGSIYKSNIGLASKDSSFTFFNQLEMKDINTCVTAYSKKQEFKGSNLSINELSCDTYLYLKDSDSYSHININKIKSSNPL